MMRRGLAVMALLAVAGSLSAQNFRGGYFLDGYLYQYKMNPAVANDVDFIGPLVGQSVTSVKSELSLKYFLFPDPDGDGLVTGLHGSVDDEVFLKPLRNEMNSLVMEQDWTLFSMGRRKGDRYHFFDATLRAGAAVNVPYDLFEFLKVGTKNKYAFDISNLFVKTHTWLELSYGQSVRLSDAVSVGARVKGLVGLSYGSVHARTLDVEIQPEYTQLKGDSDMEIAGRLIGYGMKTEEGKTDEVDMGKISFHPGKIFGVSGLGLSFDTGVQWRVTEGLTLSAALLDVGGIKWFDRMYARSPAVDFRSDPDKVLDDKEENAVNSLNAMARFIVQDKKKNTFDWMTATFNAGATYRMPFYDKLSVGLLGMYKLDNIFNWAEIRGAVSATPLPWLSISVNAGYNTYGMAYGAALAVNTRPVRFFIGTDAYVAEMTPQLVPLTRLNHNFQFGLGIPISRK